MNVLAFPQAYAPIGWRTSELDAVTAACAASIAKGSASGWEIGQTDRGDPQLYLLGPAPDYDCILTVSRLGGGYVIEDGEGFVLAEHVDRALLPEKIKACVPKISSGIAARLVVAWCAFRKFVEEKIEPIMAEPVELISHFCPQLAALA